MRGSWVVSRAEGGEPYRVRLVPDGDGVVAEVERGDERWSVPLEPAGGPGRAWSGDRPLEVEWRAGDGDGGRLILDGRVHALVVRSEAAHRARELAGSGPLAGRSIEVEAPMPGLVLTIEVEEGAAVERGQGLVVIEAMKMENEIVAPAEGVVASIPVAEGEAVEQGATLVRIEPPGEET